MVFYLKIDVDKLIGRVLESRGMDFWESGMDLKTGDDNYQSFRTYQQRLLREYGSMADEFHFRVLDARRRVDKIQEELRKQVGAFLEPAEKPDGSGRTRDDVTGVAISTAGRRRCRSRGCRWRTRSTLRESNREASANRPRCV